MLTSGVCLFYDDACPHIACLTVELLEGFDWDVLTHPPHSLDYQLFTELKDILRGECHENNDEVKWAVLNWGKDVERKFFKEFPSNN